MSKRAVPSFVVSHRLHPDLVVVSALMRSCVCVCVCIDLFMDFVPEAHESFILSPNSIVPSLGISFIPRLLSQRFSLFFSVFLSGRVHYHHRLSKSLFVDCPLLAHKMT